MTTKTWVQARCFIRFCSTSHTDINLFPDPFIETGEDMDEDMTSGHHASLDARRQLDEEEQSPEEIARNLSRRYAHRAAVRYTGDMNEIPQRLLMPSVQDASLWQVRVKVHTF